MRAYGSLSPLEIKHAGLETYTERPALHCDRTDILAVEGKADRRARFAKPRCVGGEVPKD